VTYLPGKKGPEVHRGSTKNTAHLKIVWVLYIRIVSDKRPIKSFNMLI